METVLIFFAGFIVGVIATVVLAMLWVAGEVNDMERQAHDEY